MKGWESASIDQPKSSQIAINWFDSKLSETIKSINVNYDKFRISESSDEFTSWCGMISAHLI